MESYNRFHRTLFEWERALLKLVGHDFMAEKFQRTFMAYVVYGLVVGSILVMIYTAINYGTHEKIFNLLFFMMAIQVANNDKIH